MERVLDTVLPIFKRHKFRLLLGLLSLLCVDFIQLLVPRLLKHSIDALESGMATHNTLLFYSGLILLAGAGAAVFRFCWRYFIIGFSRILEHTLRERLFSHVLSLDRAFFDKKTTGDIMAHVSNDLSAVQMACGMGLVAAVDALVVSLATIGFMFHISFKLSLIALLPMPLLIIATKKLSQQLHNRFDTVQRQFSLLTEFARSAIVSIRLIKAYTMESRQKDLFEKLGDQYMRSNLKVAIIQGLLMPAATLAGNLGLLATLLLGGALTVRKSISLGDFVAFITYLQMLIWPMMAVGWVTNISQRGITSLKRVNALLNAASSFHDNKTLGKQSRSPRDTNHPSPLPTVPSPAIFGFQRLEFSYPGQTKASLTDITFETDKGIIGISGRTGSGKSTLCKLLTRTYPVNDNSLFLNGVDVNRLDLATVRAHIAYVSQEPILFSSSIADNIRLGNFHADDEEITRAATAASLHEDILTFPSQYQTLIGEKGITLSGGQRQRLAIARAFVSNRPVLLLDDVFSTVDVETEQKILTGILDHFQGSTVIFVSNRQKILALADQILFLDQGALADTGSHDELMARCRKYRSMVARQIIRNSTPDSDHPAPWLRDNREGDHA